jgi:hypothetical protein
MSACLYSFFSYRAWKSHPFCPILYCYLCGRSGCTIFFHAFSKTAQFSENVIEHSRCILIFSTNLSETFLIWRGVQLDMIIYVHSSWCKIPVMLVRLMKTEFSRYIFEKFSNITFRANPSSGSQLFHTDRKIYRHDEANSRFSKFCVRSKKWVSVSVV